MQEIKKTVRLTGRALEAALEVNALKRDFFKRQNEISETYDRELKDLQAVTEARHMAAWDIIYDELGIDRGGAYATQTDAVPDLGFGFLIIYETAADEAMREKVETGATEQ